jgi:hypothetical protein
VDSAQQELNNFYRRLVENQERLSPEMEKVLHDHLSELYETDDTYNNNNSNKE